MIRRREFLFLAAAPALGGDLAAIKAEPSADKRYWSALTNADETISDARKHYEAGKLDEFRKSLEEAGESVELCDSTLRGTGKDPRKSPKHFKRAELKIRELLRRLESLRQEVGVDDRPPVEHVAKRMGDLHEELVADIVGRKR
jgi:hypothetical protein